MRTASTDTLRDIQSLMMRRREKDKEIRAIDQQIEQLLGITSHSNVRKPKKKTLSAEQFKAACGEL